MGVGLIGLYFFFSLDIMKSLLGNVLLRVDSVVRVIYTYNREL